MMIIDDISQFAAFADSLFTGNQIDADALNAYENIYSLYNISTTNTPAINEVAFVKYIEKNATGLKVLKGNASFSNWGLLKKDSNGNIVTQNCP
ncbi:hypothetical protein M2347_000192 [Chryseobacterium sp. H1D6B]|uniref:hypothetical protein n=1 Tax=Chryseobacterium sp. H1D6B TaxID=2940588 RepID=UPI0015C8CE94|nr:hypothetical protein [Chryseobacterium sp. H1D6B]MDH6250465.1 hypothetical protein [Chryseobacterium sp. H1D6B]